MEVHHNGLLLGNTKRPFEVALLTKSNFAVPTIHEIVEIILIKFPKEAFMVGVQILLFFPEEVNKRLGIILHPNVFKPSNFQRLPITS